jgi:hypothetical protein
VKIHAMTNNLIKTEKIKRMPAVNTNFILLSYIPDEYNNPIL